MRFKTIFLIFALAALMLVGVAIAKDDEDKYKQGIKALKAIVTDLQSQINELKAADETLLTRVVELEAQNESLKSDIEDANAAISSLESQLATALNEINKNTSTIGSNRTDIDDLQAAVGEQQELTSYISVNTGTNEVFFTGANVYIQSGSGATDSTPNGLGNLIIGYNEMRLADGNVRSGSHNLVMGLENNFSSFGGLVIGDHVDQVGAVTIDSNSNIYMRGLSVNLSSSSAMDLEAGTMDLDTFGPMTLSGSLIRLN